MPDSARTMLSRATMIYVRYMEVQSSNSFQEKKRIFKIYWVSELARVNLYIYTERTVLLKHLRILVSLRKNYKEKM